MNFLKKKNFQLSEFFIKHLNFKILRKRAVGCILHVSFATLTRELITWSSYYCHSNHKPEPRLLVGSYCVCLRYSRKASLFFLQIMTRLIEVDKNYERDDGSHAMSKHDHDSAMSPWVNTIRAVQGKDNDGCNENSCQNDHLWKKLELCVNFLKN